MTEPRDRLIARGGWAEDRLLNREGPPYGPLNSYSNVAYAIAGSVVAAVDGTAPAAALAVAMWLLATGSALYHGYKTLEANRLDWLGMFAVFGALVAHGYVPSASWLMLLGSVLLGGVYLYVTRKTGQVSFDLAMAVLLVAGSLPPAIHGTWGWLGASWGAFAVGYGLWQLDRRGSTIVGRYGHAGWHIFTALALGLLFFAQR